MPLDVGGQDGEQDVRRVLARPGLSKLSDLKPTEPVQRYEHDAPGDMLHSDTKNLDKERPSAARLRGARRLSFGCLTVQP